MFESVSKNPPDAVFGLNEDFKKDSRLEKVNLTVGVYKNDAGHTPLMRCVGRAERRLVESAEPKSYLPIDGMPGYNALIGNLILGDDLFPVKDLGPVEKTSGKPVRCCTAQTPGGTAALRVAGELLRTMGVSTIRISDPTWANHKNIFAAAELEVASYDYLGESGTGLDFDRMMNSLAQAERGEAMLLHTVCHNPTGVDLGASEWTAVSKFASEREVFPVFDFAYQGFGSGADADAAPIRNHASAGHEAIICNSFSKNFGLYGERVGGITAVCKTQDQSEAVLSQIKSIIRRTWSNPPTHGAAIVRTVLGDPELRELWRVELEEMRERIRSMRAAFVEAVNRVTPDRDLSYINSQVGMFSYSGLGKEQVAQLKDEFGIYALGTGRINICGLNSANLDYVSNAIGSVMNVVRS